MSGFITHKEMLAVMDSGQPFSMKVVRFDKKRAEKAGRVIEIDSAILLKNYETSEPEIGESALDTAKRIGQYFNAQSPKTPNHAEHGTLNVQPCFEGRPTGERPMKIHTRLVIEFNEKTTLP